LLINEIFREKKQKDKLKILQQYQRSILDEFIFNEDIYGEMKSVPKFKFLYIGMQIWEKLLQGAKQNMKSSSMGEVLSSMITPNFLRILVRNLGNQKN
jgi:hypothetical protein